MAKVFITSATGYIGNAVAKAFKEHGHDVTALTRSEQSAKQVKQDGFTSHTGDLAKADTYQSHLAQYDIVVHTAAIFDATFAQTEKQTAEAIINALKGTNKTFIYTSGVWLLGNTGDTVATEVTAPNANATATKWRADLEKQIIEAAKQEIKTVVIRPGIVYGQGGGLVSHLVQEARTNGEAQYIGNADNHWSVINVEDLAELYVLAATKSTAGELYNATEAQAPTVKEYADAIAEAAGVSGKVKSVTVEEAKKTYGQLAPLVDGLALNQQIDSAKAKNKLGWAPQARNLVQELKVQRKELAATK